MNLDNISSYLNEDVVWITAFGVLFLIVSFAIAVQYQRHKLQEFTSQQYQKSSQRLSYLVFGLFTVVLILASTIVLTFNKQATLESFESSLSVVRDATIESLNSWYQSQSALHQHLSHYPLIRSSSSKLVKSNNIDALELHALMKRIDSLLHHEGVLVDALDFSLLDTKFKTIYSLQGHGVGEPSPVGHHRKDLLGKVLEGEDVFIPPFKYESQGEERVSMFFASSVRGRAGEIVSILLLELDPEKELSNILNRARMVDSGETYIVDQFGMMLSESRFVEQFRRIGLLQQGESTVANLVVRDPLVNLLESTAPPTLDGELPLTTMAASIAKKERGISNVIGYRDYRGVMVFGAWSWVDSLGVGVATEIDRAEALKAYKLMRVTLLGFLIVTLSLAFGALLFSLKMSYRASQALLTEKDELRSHVEARAAEVEAIIGSAADGIIIIDHHGIIQVYNPAAEKIFGYSPEEVIGKNISLLVSGQDKEVHDQYIHRYLQTNIANIVGRDREVEAVRKDGSVFPLFISIGEIKSSRGWQFVSIVRDISDRKMHELALKNAKEEAEQANRAKSEFLANMSHELRTPMHGILSFSELGISRLEKVDKSKLGDYFGHIHQSGARLLSLLNNLLDLSKLEAGKMNLKYIDTDLKTISASACEEQMSVMQKKNIHWSVKVEPEGLCTLCTCDSQRIFQVIANLLSNAIKFSPENSQITILIDDKLSRLQSGNGGASDPAGLRVRVQDQGVGIPEEELEVVFDKFIQSSHTNSGANGTGLGLAICREIVSQHGGVIYASNRDGQGAEFIFELPARHDKAKQVA